MITCPDCGTAVQPTWDWCEVCGFDPDGLRPPGRPLAHARARPVTAGAPTATSSPPLTSTTPDLPVAGPSRAPRPEDDHARRDRRPATMIVLAVVAFAVVVAAATGGMRLLGRDPDDPGAGTAASQAAPAPAPDTPWTTYTADGGAATIEFPRTPAAQEAPLAVEGEVAQTTVATQDNDTSYLFGYYDISPERTIEDPALTLGNALDGFVASAGLTGVSRTSSQHAGFPSVDVTAATATGQLRATAVLDGHRLYLIAAFDTPAAPAQWLRFLSSWQLR